MDDLQEMALDAYDRFLGLELAELAVDCCITKARAHLYLRYAPILVRVVNRNAGLVKLIGVILQGGALGVESLRGIGVIHILSATPVFEPPGR